MKDEDLRTRCEWAMGSEMLTVYHDREWGVPVHDDGRFFEFILLESAQAGLSWSTVLRKREGYREAFKNFDFCEVAQFDGEITANLLKNGKIIRNRSKIESAIENAKALIEVRKEFGSFDSYIWKFVCGKQIRNRWIKQNDIPSKTPISEIMSKDLTRRGFRFMGPTVCYSLMQATGLVNDHLVSCFRYREI